MCVCVDETTVLVSILKSNHSKPTDSVLRTQQINKNPIPTFPIKKNSIYNLFNQNVVYPSWCVGCIGVHIVLYSQMYSTNLYFLLLQASTLTLKFLLLKQ